MRQLSLKDLLLGSVFTAFGLLYGSIALVELHIGTPLQMGPGFFPVALSAILIVIGLATAFQGVVIARAREGFGSFAWRGLAAISVATIAFALTVQGLGLPLAIVLTVILASLASSRTTALRAGMTAAIMAALCTGVFIYGLKVPVPLIGSWFGS